MSKKWIVGSVVVAVLALSAVTAALADEDDVVSVESEDYGTVWMLNDGRINGFDLSAPVAIYYTTETVTNDDGDNVDQVDGIEMLTINPDTGNGSLLMDLSLDALEPLVNGSVETIEANGYSLNYDSGWFWVTSPADSEGKVYSFAWENQVLSVD